MWCELLGRDVDINTALAAANKVSAWLLALAVDGEPDGSVTQEEIALFLTFNAWAARGFTVWYRQEERMIARLGGEARG